MATAAARKAGAAAPTPPRATKKAASVNHRKGRAVAGGGVRTAGQPPDGSEMDGHRPALLDGPHVARSPDGPTREDIDVGKGVKAPAQAGQVISYRREKQLGWSLSEAARRANVAQATWANLESTRKKRYNKGTLDKAARVLGWPGNFLTLIERGQGNDLLEMPVPVTTDDVGGSRHVRAAVHELIDGLSEAQLIEVLASLASAKQAEHTFTARGTEDDGNVIQHQRRS